MGDLRRTDDAEATRAELAAVREQNERLQKRIDQLADEANGHTAHYNAAIAELERWKTQYAANETYIIGLQRAYAEQCGVIAMMLDRQRQR